MPLSPPGTRDAATGRGGCSRPVAEGGGEIAETVRRRSPDKAAERVGDVHLALAPLGHRHRGQQHACRPHGQFLGHEGQRLQREIVDKLRPVRHQHQPRVGMPFAQAPEVEGRRESLVAPARHQAARIGVVVVGLQRQAAARQRVDEAAHPVALVVVDAPPRYEEDIFGKPPPPPHHRRQEAAAVQGGADAFSPCIRRPATGSRQAI